MEERAFQNEVPATPAEQIAAKAERKEKRTSLNNFTMKVAKLMRTRLEAKTAKYPEGWGKCSDDVLVRKLCQSCIKFRAAVESGDVAEIAKRGADVMNLTAMIADNHGAIQ